MKVLFLDIDGVLNNNSYANGKIHLPLVRHLNQIIAETDANVVISSAWRYLVHDGHMSVRGFEAMLESHGAVDVHVIDITCRDTTIRGRGAQIKDWLRKHPEVTSYAILDDDPVLWEIDDERLVETDGRIGLTAADAKKAIAWLRRSLRSRQKCLVQ